MRRLLQTLLCSLVLGLVLSACGTARPYMGMLPQDVLQEGLRHMQDEDWNDAIDAFEHVLFSFPSFEGAPQARFHLAEAYFNQEDYLTAASEYVRFRDRYPTHEWTPQAALGVCRSYLELSPIVQRDQSYTRQAYEECSNVARDYPGTESGRRAAELRDRMWDKLGRKLLIAAEFYMSRDMFDSAIIYLEDIWQNYRRTSAAPQAVKLLIEANQEIGYADEAQTWRERLLSDFPDSPQAEEVRSNRANGA